MENYRTIVVAVELNPQTDKLLLDASAELAKKTGATITLLHVIEHVGSYGGLYGITVGAEVEQRLEQEARKEMEKLGEMIKVFSELQVIVFGSAKAILAAEAANLKADLIVVGSHGRHGIQILLGSTANAVLHHAKCDVLVIRTDNVVN